MEEPEVAADLDVIKKIEEDEFLKTFLTANLKSELLKNLSITEQMKKLGDAIELVSRELQMQVVAKHKDLISQATHANKLEAILSTMNMHMHSLFANAERLKAQIVAPYQILEMQTNVLGRLHLASHILRQVSRIQQLSKRLSNLNDPVQKATILQELEQLTADPSLTEIDAVTTELRNIRTQQQKVIKLATSSLTQGIATENSTQTSTALQIFINLGTIKSAIENVLQTCLNDCRDNLKFALDPSGGTLTNINKKQTGPGSANITSSQGFRSRVWSDLEKTFTEEFYRQCKQIKFLQECLLTVNLRVKENQVDVEFWDRLSRCISEEMGGAIPAIQQTLEADYPKFLKCYTDMISRLNRDAFGFNRAVVEKWENSYLSNSLNRLLEPTQSVFNQENVSPSHDQIDSIIRNITNEISVALVEEYLSEKIAKNVSKCIRLFAVKTEQQLATGVEAAQVIAGTPNPGQQLNIQLANALYYLNVQVQRMLTNMKESLSEKAVSTVSDSLQGLDNLTGVILQPLIANINSTIETIIVTIHLEQDWLKLQPPINRNACSPYMRELTQFILRINHTYLVPFENKEVLGAKCNEVVIRCIELLVRHSSILRPISQGGRLRLQVDYIFFENALKVLCPYLADLGRPYRLLKSMASLIMLSPQEIVDKQKSGSSVQHSTVLLLLFSYAGNELASPHQNTSWSVSKLSQWMDEHQLESDRLDLIAGALQRYENIIRQKNLVNYDPLYPVMSEFLEFAMKPH